MKSKRPAHARNTTRKATETVRRSVSVCEVFVDYFLSKGKMLFSLKGSKSKFASANICSPGHAKSCNGEKIIGSNGSWF